MEYVNRSLNALLKEIEELKVKLAKTAELAAADNSDVNGISSAKEYLAAHFEEIPLLRRRELIKRIIDKVVWNGEQLEVTSRLFSPLRSRLQVAGERDAGRVKLRARSLAGGEQ